MSYSDVSQSSDYIDPIRDGWMGSRIAEVLGISTPYTRQDLCDFFEAQLKLYDAYRAERDASPVPDAANPIPQGVRTQFQSSLTDEMRAVIAARVRHNIPSAAIRAELKQQFGVEVSSSHMSHMRKRIFRKDTL